MCLSAILLYKLLIICLTILIIFIIITLLKMNILIFAGTPLHNINREKQQSACRTIGDSIKKHIFHKTILKTPKPNTPSSSSTSAAKITKTPLASVSS